MKKSDFDVTHQNKNLESKIVVSLERIAQSFRVLLWEESKRFALSPIQVQVLIFLLTHSEEKRKVSYLAEEFNMTKATISDTVKTLEQKQLVTKEAEPHDSRSYVIWLTPEGREIALQTSLFTHQLREPIEKMGQDEKENLLLSLMQMIRHLNQSGTITIQRMCLSCTHYRSSTRGKKHFCALLNQPLFVRDLRVDCPEHSPSEA